MKREPLLNLFASMTLTWATATLYPVLAQDTPSTRSYVFTELWEGLRRHSHDRKAQELTLEAQRLSLSRAKKDLWPSLSLRLDGLTSNDPGQVFFAHLGQRSIQATDFAPSALNHPGYTLYGLGTLGAQWTFYKGGRTHKLISWQEHLAQSAYMEQSTQEAQEYATLAQHYALALASQDSAAHIKTTAQEVDRLIAGYRVGSKSNPLGYSGLLGLRGLASRLKGLGIQRERDMLKARHWIENKVALSEPFRPAATHTVGDFITAHLLSPSTFQERSSTLAVEQEMLKASVAQAALEKARYRPTVGLFAANHAFAGERDFEMSQSLGIFLQWALFEPDNYGRTTQAHLDSQATQLRFESLAQNESIERRTLLDQEQTLKRSLEVLKESQALLQEQMKASTRLFQAGLISALQLSEVINRRVDVSDAVYTTQVAYISLASRLYTLTH